MCFGGGSSKPQVVSTGSQQITDKSWETLEPYIKNALEASRSRFEDQLETGYQPMPGGFEARYEGPSAEELASREGILQQGLSGIAGTGMASSRPYYESGLSALQSSMGQFGPQQAQQYMNPYQQAVVDVAKREAVRSAQPTFRGIGDRAEATGAFGGSRQAIAEAEANRNLQQQLGDIQTTGMQQAFQQGRGAFEAQKAREAAGAARLFGQAPQAWQQGIREMGAVEQVGKARRGDEQAKKDFLYEQFEAEKGYPSQVYGEHLGHVRGFPYQPSMYKTTTTSRPDTRPGTAQSLLGAGMGIASMGKNMGWWGGASGGQVQGGLSGLVQRHQNNAPVDYSSLNEYEQQLYDIGGSPYLATETETVDVTDPQTSPTDWSGKYLENLSETSNIYKVLADKIKKRYGPDYKEKETARLAKAKKDAAWDSFGRFGQSLMLEKDWRDAAGKSKIFDEMAEARKAEEAGLLKLEDKEIEVEGQLAGLKAKQLQLKTEIIKAGQAGDIKKAELLTKQHDALLKAQQFELDAKKYSNQVAKFIHSKDFNDTVALGNEDQIREALELSKGKHGISDKFIKDFMGNVKDRIKKAQLWQASGGGADRIVSLNKWYKP